MREKIGAWKKNSGERGEKDEKDEIKGERKEAEMIDIFMFFLVVMGHLLACYREFRIREPP